MPASKYVLITAARNEELLIEDTIKSVISQTIKPIKWIIVSDNSTDRTDIIVESYVEKYNFIELIKKVESNNRDFASKVYAVNLAISKVDKLYFDFIGILDADITFDNNYYESMLNEFKNNPRLGIAGGEFYDIVGTKKIRVMKSSQSVRGGVQLFRKECFEQIGKFTPLKYGGEDIITEVTARKNGWDVKSFDHQMLEHHRLTGTGGWNILEAKFREGANAYAMGYHPLFQISKSLYRVKERPYIISGVLHLLGFFWANIKRSPRVVNKEFIDYLRNEQLTRIKTLSL